MTTNKPSAGAMRAAQAIENHLRAGLPVNEDFFAALIDEETGMQELIEAAEAVMEWQMRMYMERNQAGLTFRNWLGSRTSVGKLYDALTKAKGESDE